jgi:hypothetical protein
MMDGDGRIETRRTLALAKRLRYMYISNKGEGDMGKGEYAGAWSIGWDGHSVTETLELALRRDGAYDVRHTGEGQWMGSADFDRLEEGLSLFDAIERCIRVVELFEASMRSGDKDALLGALLSDAGLIKPWSKAHGSDFRALSRRVAARRERAQIGRACRGAAKGPAALARRL